jgi:hypothetical protein
MSDRTSLKRLRMSGSYRDLKRVACVAGVVTFLGLR